ncbi:hypothetical protein V8G61_00350 [Gaetbulibacter sp. M240]|uniref:hypothetical protein n=1 Tax=Gaetbulibacter sp. M240 TaxID=3126511 RepID=UPI00374F41FF
MRTDGFNAFNSNILLGHTCKVWSHKAFLILFLFSCFIGTSQEQVAATIDSTTIKIGQQINYNISVKTDSTKLVVFPEGKSFSPLEIISSYPIDTLQNNDTYRLVKKYGLTQFDSGQYTIPRQKVLVGDKTFYTDSLQVMVNTIAVDTTKQGLYDIKPIIEVEKAASNWWKYALIILLILAIAAFLVYWFIWRKKPMTEKEIALLPPYDRAKLALKKLDESPYLEQQNLKDYYSELTFIIRKYLDEKVYDRALESTTGELIDRLNLLKDGNRFGISNEDIENLERILRRADLVKFAKSAPDIELAKLDRETIDAEIDHVKEALPEPTEEEKLLDEQYRKALARKKKRRKIILTVISGIALLSAIYVGFSLKYGFVYVKDTIIGHESKELLEGTWVTSEYGAPPITISTPKVLGREQIPMPKAFQGKMKVNTFGYENLGRLSIVLSNVVLEQPQDSLDLNNVINGTLKTLEAKGAQNIITKTEKFTTPNGAEGIKTFGSLEFPIGESDDLRSGKYALLTFTSENRVIQQILMTWRNDDVYLDDIAQRVINAVELVKAKEE